MKQRQSYTCTACNKQYGKWVGCCSSCDAWDSIVESAAPAKNSKSSDVKRVAIVAPLYECGQCIAKDETRFASGIQEWDRVLGGGLVAGSFILLAGDPGIGKSTLLLQISAALSAVNKVLYISSEESVQQVALRAKRLSECGLDALLVAYCCNVYEIIETIRSIKPHVVIIDSLQNCQIDECFLTTHGNSIRNVAHLLLEVVKAEGCALIVTGHITKDGAVAGPKMLEHLVDVVLHLSGEDGGHVRLLRASKNRFGSTEEIGLFSMNGNGLIEQKNAQALLIEHYEPTIGSVLTCHTEGSRDFIIEIQVLTVPTQYGNPQRVITGIDHKQLILVCAVLERYLRIPLHSHDVFCKITGTMRVKSNAVSCALALAVLSSFIEKPLKKQAVIIGELGLTGDISLSSCSRMPFNLLLKHGINYIACPQSQNKLSENENNDVKICPINSVYDIRSLLMA